MQADVRAATRTAHIVQIATVAARDVDDARIDTALALRRWSAGSTGAARVAAAGERAMSAALQRLAVSSVSIVAARQRVQRIQISATRIMRLFGHVASSLRHGRASEATAILNSPEYYIEVSALRSDVLAYVSAARTAQTQQFDSFSRLWNESVVLLIAALSALVLACAVVLYRSLRAAKAIQRVGQKVHRYHEVTGAVHQGDDVIGDVDAAVQELLEAQAQIARELERYRLLADVTRDGIIFLDRESLTIIDTNAAIAEMYGYDRRELVGRQFSLLKAHDEHLDPDEARQVDAPAGLSIEREHRRADGNVFPVEMNARTATIDGRRVVVTTVRDVSERRRVADELARALQDAVEASRAKSEFVATMSHEIRTPMQGVIGMGELLVRSPLAPAQREYAETVIESARGLLGVIDDILDFSKLESHKLTLDTVEFASCTSVDVVLKTLAAAAQTKGLVFTVTTAPDVPPLVLGDELRLRQILMNLIGNAVKFTDGGSIAIASELEANDDASCVIRFSVSDTGIGIPAELRPRLFEPFTQGDGSTTRRFGGSGLGLSICRRLAELMGGRIWLAEHEGAGSTFCFSAHFKLLRTPAPAESGPSAPAVAALPNAHTAGARILLVEDSPLIRRVATSQLEALGYVPAVVENGLEAVDAFRPGAFDVILMDMRMPEMDGLEATRAIRALERTHGGHVTIIALTANVVDSDRKACMDAGMDDFLGKPFQLDAIKAKLDDWLGRASGE